MGGGLVENYMGVDRGWPHRTVTDLIWGRRNPNSKGSSIFHGFKNEKEKVQQRK